ncbi:MAG TPA: energy transducer TonB [Terriglobales bacterium]|nr:energy transducer TonB [Terriglobales bacterium]
MANSVLIPKKTGSSSNPHSDANQHLVRMMYSVEQSWLSSLISNLHDVFFPEKLPPLQLTAKPAPVREIWGDYDNHKQAATTSVIVHILMVALLIAMSYAGKKTYDAAKKQETVTLVAPDLSEYVPLSSKKNDTIGGGGGGGDRDKLQAPKGKLPKLSMEQITPPAVVIRNDNPKLAVEPTVVVPPQVKLPSNGLPNLGDPLSKVSGPPSNGVGSGGGIGSGSGGGVGSGSGPGVGPGSGGGIGGGVFRVGGGVSAPRPLSTPDPEYSEEARKAKYQGVVVLWLIVDQNGNPRDIRVSRSLGLGLDEKAVEAVRRWRFEPAMKDGRPVPVQINVEVSFRLY